MARRLGDRKLALDGGADLPRGHLAVREQFQYAAPYRIPQDVERVHNPSLEVNTYISQAYIYSDERSLR